MTKVYASRYHQGKYTAANWVIYVVSQEHHHGVDLVENFPHWNKS